MNKFDTITQELDNVTGGSYWSRMAYARAAWFNPYGFGGYGGFGPMAPRPWYSGYPSPRAQARAYAWANGFWG